MWWKCPRPGHSPGASMGTFLCQLSLALGGSAPPAPLLSPAEPSTRCSLKWAAHLRGRKQRNWVGFEPRSHLTWDWGRRERLSAHAGVLYGADTASVLEKWDFFTALLGVWELLTFHLAVTQLHLLGAGDCSRDLSAGLRVFLAHKGYRRFKKKICFFLLLFSS